MDSTEMSNGGANGGADAPPDPYQIYTAVAQKLVETLNGILHPDRDHLAAIPPQVNGHQHVAPPSATAAISPADLEIILDMIQTNLTFDDPGIYFAQPTAAQPRARRMQSQFNRWLHHQIVYIASRFASDSLRRKAADLQHEMLAAAWLKQRWLFKRLVRRYAKLLGDLCAGSKLPLEVWTSQDTDDEEEGQTEATGQSRAPNFSRIEIATIPDRDRLAIAILGVLQQATALYCNSDPELLREAAAAAMAGFERLGLAGKTHALQFFGKIVRRLWCPDDGEKAVAADESEMTWLRCDVVPKLLQGVQQIGAQLPVWMDREEQAAVRSKDVRRFVATLGYVLGLKELSALCGGAQNLEASLQMCTALLAMSAIQGGGGGGRGDAPDAELRQHFDGKFAMCVLAFGGRVMQLNSGTISRIGQRTLLARLFGPGQCGRLEPDAVRLLQSCVAQRLRDDTAKKSEEDDAVEAPTTTESESPAIWSLIDELIAYALQADRRTTEAILMEQCRHLNTIAAMLLAAEHDFQLWHQRGHSDESAADCEVCQSPSMLTAAEESEPSQTIRQTSRRLRQAMHSICSGFDAQLLQDEAMLGGLLRSADACFELCDTAWRLFGTRHARSMAEAVQLRLLDVAMCTLAPAPTTICPAISTLVAGAVPAEVLQFHEHLMHTIRTTNLRGLAPELRRRLAERTAAIEVQRLDRRTQYDLWQHWLVQAEMPLVEVLEGTLERDVETTDAAKGELVARLVRVLVCAAGGDAYTVTAEETLGAELMCRQCHAENASDCADSTTTRRLSHPSPPTDPTTSAANLAVLLPHLRRWLPPLFHPTTARLQTRLDAVAALPALASHFCPELVHAAGTAWLGILRDPVAEVQLTLAARLPSVLVAIHQNASTGVPARQRRLFFEHLFAELSDSVQLCLDQPPASEQAAASRLQAGVVGLVRSVGCHPGATEVTVLQSFCLLLFFLVRVESRVAKVAALAATEMCRHFGTTVRRLVAWHRGRVFELLAAAAVANALQWQCSLQRTLSNFCHLLGFQNLHATFVPHYSGSLLAALLPWRGRHGRVCEALVEELCQLQNRTKVQVVAAGFLHVYPSVWLRYAEGAEGDAEGVVAEEERAKREGCVAWLLEMGGGHDLVWHLKADSRRTLNEILIWYHRNPEFVMQTLRQLIGPPTAPPPTTNSTSSSTSTSTTTFNAPAAAAAPLSAICDYIAARFLGVLNYFGVVLVATDLEKSLQSAMLLSLGAIIRFMGAAHITPFRFKILTVLRSVLAIGDTRPRLRDICAKVWRIFVRTVDVSAMGPLLPICVVHLEPLMRTHADLVDDILRYLIVTNGSLLSLPIAELFFIERTAASAEIRARVAAAAAQQPAGFEARFRLLARHCTHENIDVRVHALQYLSELCDAQRASLNELLGGAGPADAATPRAATLLQALLAGARHADGQLQLAAGRCLGAVGAIDPSQLPPNYAPQRRSALGIHTDVFATMALAELCRAYQFQKDTKRVDGFSLAIQEILLARGVQPEQQRKLNVWNAIPVRMRELMAPLLRSCYTALPTGVQPQAHPIYARGRFPAAEGWACAWAARLTDAVGDEDTRHLLKSFKTSVRNDVGVLGAFLPYVVLHAVQSCGEEDLRKIEEELRAVFGAVLAEEEAEEDELAEKCAKIAFAQLEFLAAWLRQYQVAYSNATDEPYRRVADLLAKFEARLMAAANFRCGEYARALQYLEVHLSGSGGAEEGVQQELSFLAQCYAELLDSDALEGALRRKAAAQPPTLAEQVLLHRARNRLQESTVCFEQMMQQQNVHGAQRMDEQAICDMIQCYVRLDQPETALMVAGAVQRQQYAEAPVPSAVLACSAEPLWRLGRFEELDELLQTAKLRDAPDWGIRCGQVLLAWRTGGTERFSSEVERCQLSVLGELRTHDGDELGSYDKVYPLVLRLHQVAEMQQCQRVVEEVVKQVEANSGGGGETEAVAALKRMLGEWDARLELLQPTAKILEPVLCLRRTILTETKSLLARRIGTTNNDATTIVAPFTRLINTYIGDSLMRSTQLARSADMYQQAQLFLLNAEQHAPAQLFVERARLAWARGDQASALGTLERGLEAVRQQLDGGAAPSSTRAEAKRCYGEAKLLFATYSADSQNTNTTLNVRYFKEAMQAAGDSEQCYVQFAQYMEKVLATLSSAEQAGARGNDAQQEIMTCYGRSMAYGSRYVYQSMPRFLSIWLDFTARTSTATSSTVDPPSATDSHRKVSQNMTKIVDHFADTLPAFVFFTAFSQLVSRICHPSADVYQGLKTIIIRLLKTYTQQSMWMIMCVYKSSYASRVKRCTEIFSDRRLAERGVQKLINDFNLLAERMIELTNKPVQQGDKLTMATFYRELPALLKTPGFSKILLPTNRYMLAVLPSGEQRDKPAAADFNAFPQQAVYIAGCQNDLVVMPSLQKPKRITLIGDDGRDYMIMMKPKDDLRKDFRLMEFNAIVNRYLRQDAEARQRRLRIRTYAVLPLNEECGIIEWLVNLQALRPIVMELLKRKHLGVSSRELRELYRPARDPAGKRALLTGTLIPRHPPQLADWYLERFSTAHNWYLARTAFVRTTASISMAGYLLGLGDRHGENILFDTSNGDTVHVDFNCLFNKGECFEVPELVPFRLTHNMVHAMGALGVEGGFRQCAQIVMRVLREQQATLMSVLRPFAYDPLVSWNRVMSKTDGRQERTDTQAITNVKRIEERLRGFVKQNGVMATMALSAEGVVNHCIAEATDVNKLASMYMGWGPFI